MKILIVGGTGVISSAVLNLALDLGNDVTCITRGNNHGVSIDKRANSLHFDARNLDVAEGELKDSFFDVVIDFVCFNKKQTEKSLKLFFNKCTQYIFISTDSVYKIQSNGFYDESTPLSNPEWNYSFQKAECESLVKDFCNTNEQKYTIVRPSLTYGDTRIPYGLMPSYGYHGTIVERIKKGKPIVTWNSGKNKQTIMRVEDFAVGLLALCGNQNAYDECFGICGDCVTWSDVLDAIDNAIGVKSNKVDATLDDIISVFPEREGEFLIDRSKDHIVSNKKLCSIVPSFECQYDISNGTRHSIDYYVKNNNLLGIDYSFDAKLDRLIEKATKGRVKCGFIKYSGNVTVFDRYYYYISRHDDFLRSKLIPKIVNIITKVFKKVF